MSALTSLLASIPANSLKCVSSGGAAGDPFTAALLPRTVANFDFNGTTYGSNPTVLAAMPATIAAGFAFSAPAISETNGYLVHGPAGGHTDSGDSSVFGFDLQAAAVSLAGTWTRLVDGAKYSDAFNTTKPAWSTWTLNMTPSGLGQ